MGRLLHGALALLLALVATPANAVDPVGEMYRVQYVRTVDGDTIIVRGTDENDEWYELTIRLFDVSCPELGDGTSASFAAAEFTALQLENASAVFIEIDETALTDSDGLALAWVWYWLDIPELGTYQLQLNEQLLRQGHAVLYEATQGKRYSEELMEATK